MEFTIANARLVDDQVVDVVVSDGVITEIGNGLNKGKKIDAEKNLLIPGLVDLHTHLREPGREDSETVASGSAASATPWRARAEENQPARVGGQARLRHEICDAHSAARVSGRRVDDDRQAHAPDG